MEPIYILADTQRVNFQDIKVTQNDSNVKFIIKVQQGGKDLQLSADTIYTLTSLRDDRVAVLSPNLGVVTGRNEITFNLGTKELAVTGVVRASVQMISDDGRISTLSFNYSVVRDLSNAEPSEEDKSLIQVVLQDGPEIIEAARLATIAALEAAENANNAGGGGTGDIDGGHFGDESTTNIDGGGF